MICQINGALTFFVYYFSWFFLRLIITCRLWVIYVREDNYSNVWVMIKRLIWTIWTPMSSVLKKADKLNLSLSHPWPWPWIFKVKFWKSNISGMGWPIDMELKECKSIECWTHVVTFNVHLTHDIDLGFSRSNFENALSREWDGWLTWNNRDVSR